MNAVGSALHSVLDPRGWHAAQIHTLWLVMLWVCCTMYLLVLVFGVLAAIRKRREAGEIESRGLRRTLVVWATLIVLGLSSLTFMSYLTDRAVATGRRPADLHIDVTSHQWWWEIEYTDGDLQDHARTANELHLPVGRTSNIHLRSTDVIHSFWVPSLHGKVDLIPGRENVIEIRPEHSGVYRGTCAEFCGAQHAKMAFDVIAEPEGDFAKWRRQQLQPAADTDEPRARAGSDLFQQKACSLCHMISGTDANASVGPDLTHLASRTTLAAGALPNTPGALAIWLADPQSVKPGCRMPRIPLTGDELQALVAYLSSLK